MLVSQGTIGDVYGIDGFKPVKFIKKAAKKTAKIAKGATKLGVKAALLPITAPIALSKTIATTAARAAGGAAGTLIKTPFSALSAAAKGLASPFKKAEQSTLLGISPSEIPVEQVFRAPGQMVPSGRRSGSGG